MDCLISYRWVKASDGRPCSMQLAIY